MKKIMLIPVMFLLVLTLASAGDPYTLVESQSASNTYDYVWSHDDEPWYLITSPKDMELSRWNFTLEGYHPVDTTNRECWMQIMNSDGTIAYGNSSVYKCNDFVTYVIIDFPDTVSLSNGVVYRHYWRNNMTDGHIGIHSQNTNPYAGTFSRSSGNDLIFVYYENDDVDETPPILSGLDCTSHESGSNTDDPLNCTGDLTPTITVTSDEASTGLINNVNGSGWQECTTTGATSHTCTLPFNKTLSCGSGQYVYWNFTNSVGLSVYNKTEIWACDAAPAGGDTQELIQYIQVTNYTDTNITYNRTFIAINFYTEEKSFDIPSLTGWTLVQGTDPLIVTGQATNKTVYQNVSQRGDSDVWFDITEVTATATSNSLLMILPVDPPLKSCVFKTTRTLTGQTLTCDTLQVWGGVDLILDTTTTIITDRVEIADLGKIIIDDTSSIN